MDQFLRFALLIILLVVGFGTGICGVLGLGYSANEAFGTRGSADNFTGLVVAFSLVGAAIALGCWFGIRALMRRIREHAAARDGQAPPPGG